MTRRGYADGPFGQVHYQDNEADGPAIILLHQAPLSSRQFDLVYEPLGKAGIRAIGVDYPGLGLSDTTPEPPSIADYAAVIPAVMDHLGIDKAHLGGHHTGTKVANEAALVYADRILSISLSSPAPMTAEEQAGFKDTILKKEMEFGPKEDGSHFMELWEPRLPWIKDHHPDALQLCTSYVVQPLMAYGPFWYGHNAAFNYDSVEALPKVTQPVLVIANTTDMLYPMAAKTMELCPHFHYVEIEGGGVDVVDICTQDWVDAIKGFFDEIGAFG